MVVDVLHQHSGPDVTWSRVNMAETVVGVQTPLSWCCWDDFGEMAFRLGYRQLKLVPKGFLNIPDSIDEQFTAVFYGQGACNLDAFRVALAAMPGNASAAAEAGFFSSSGPGRRIGAAKLRRLVVRAWLPLYGLSAPRRLARLRSASRSRWQHALRELPSADRVAATRLLHEMLDSAAHEVAAQIAVSTLVGMAHGAIQALLEQVGRSDLELTIIGGYGGTEEMTIAQAMWDVAHGGADITRFLADHGFHGPAEGELSSFSWREQPYPVESLVDSFKGMADDADPRTAERAAIAARVQAEQTVIGSFTGLARWRARRVLATGRRIIPLRVVAKAAFTQTFDGARIAARVIGRHLVTEGRIDDAEDVFYLSLEELDALGASRDDLRATVTERRATRERYLGVELPLMWTGMPEPVATPDGPGSGPDDTDPDGTASEEIVGIGVSSGIVEGTAHVLADPGDPSAFAPGDILVCHTTDPSWTSYFLMASGVVIDIGGTLSHGAIVARELGIPCVMNYPGTRLLRTGDRIAVDGTAGTVRVVSRAETPDPTATPTPGLV
jgi:phosphohistidine swiveling domain-containing protein